MMCDISAKTGGNLSLPCLNGPTHEAEALELTQFTKSLSKLVTPLSYEQHTTSSLRANWTITLDLQLAT